MKSIADFTKDEFSKFIEAGSDPSGKSQKKADAFIGQFNELVPHPAKSDLLYWPTEGADDSPEGVVAEIERYCRENGLPGFKDSGF
jgi:hypothetical protein